MTLRSIVRAMALCCLSVVPVPFRADAQATLPWALRNHYSFPAGHAVLRYAEANAAWRVELADPAGGIATPLVDEIGFDLRLTDGTVLTGDTLGTAECIRENIAGPQGESTCYTVRFPVKNGLAIEHRLTRFGNRLFVVMDVSVRNEGTVPVGIVEISPMVMGPGAPGALGADAEVTVRSLAARGGGVVVRGQGGGGLTLFHLPTKQALLAVGLLAEGRADVSCDFRFSNATWQGRVTCAYAPQVTLMPGESLRSDRLWVSHGTPASHQVDLQYAWMLSTLPRPIATTPGSLAWVTIEDSGGLYDLLAAARTWRPSGVRHALVPTRWEGRPGSMTGATPRYPRNMGQAADAIRQAGCAPGITVDPLLGEDGQPEWAARDEDGQIWLDLTHEKARETAVERLRRLFAGGFDFVVVSRSLIPDAALTQFGQSRAQADRLAFEIAAAAAEKRPVYPTAETTLATDHEAWCEAAAAASRIAYYQVPAGAVRVDARNGASLDDEAVAALRLWPGSLELLGEGSGAFRDALGRALAEGRLLLYPVDAASHAPSLWQRDFEDQKLGYLGGTVMAFPGGRPWTPATLNMGNAGERVLWNPADGGIIPESANPVPDTGRTAIYGIAPMNGHPTLMGASGGWLLHLDRLDDVSWDAQSGILRGVVRGPFARGMTGHVLVPPAWTYADGKVGGERLRVRQPGARISFALEGDATAFELRFEQRL